METDTVTLVAGLTSLFAVALLFLSVLVSGKNGGTAGLGKGRSLFKTGNPTLTGKTATQGLQRGHVDVPATLEAAQQGVTR